MHTPYVMGLYYGVRAETSLQCEATVVVRLYLTRNFTSRTPILLGTVLERGVGEVSLFRVYCFESDLGPVSR